METHHYALPSDISYNLISYSQVLKNTMMDKHFAKELKDSINQESQEISKAL